MQGCKSQSRSGQNLLRLCPGPQQGQICCILLAKAGHWASPGSRMEQTVHLSMGRTVRIVAIFAVGGQKVTQLSLYYTPHLLFICNFQFVNCFPKQFYFQIALWSGLGRYCWLHFRIRQLKLEAWSSQPGHKTQVPESGLPSVRSRGHRCRPASFCVRSEGVTVAGIAHTWCSVLASNGLMTVAAR